MRIYLVGFMATGKSTLGQRAASTFGVPFFDTDQVIESQAGMTIVEIFKTHGEDYFRHLESDVLKQTAYYPQSINATGGGLPCIGDNMDWMNKHGITFYLQWPDDVITLHLIKLRATRPLLAGLEESTAEIKIKDLLALRKPVYEQSAITLEMKGNEESDYLLLEKACKYIW